MDSHLNTGLSTAVPVQQNTPQITLAQLSPAAGIPRVNTADLSLVPVADRLPILRFPSDTPMYYTLLKLGDYTRAGWNAAGQTNTKAGIVLPLPELILDAQNIDFQDVPLGFAGALAVQGFKKAGIAGATIGALEGVAADRLKDALLNNRIADAVLSAAGVAIDNFLVIALRGPEFRRYQMQWRLSPNTPKETAELQKIIELLHDSAAPALLGAFNLGSAFFSFPYVVDPSLNYLLGSGAGTPNDLGKYTVKWKTSVMQSIEVNYTEGGLPAFHGVRQQIGPGPAVISLRIQFLELSYMLRGDYAALNNTGMPADQPGIPDISDLKNFITSNFGT